MRSRKLAESIRWPTTTFRISRRLFKVYISLYRRYRPQNFSDIIGQSAAVSVVTRAIESGAIGHAYLFSGPRGCGKTTVARLFAKAVNCPDRKGAEPCNVCQSCRSIVEGSCLDVVEIDGASNNGVDEIRDLKERVALASFNCPYKIYIIDEVHMLSISAFNALLKTLEEPPERVVFILATTAPYKVPATIRSRCQHIPFHAMTPLQIVTRLRQVSSAEGIDMQEEALWEIARNADGGMRDALSLMEQAMAIGAGSVTRETVDKLLGGGSSSSVRAWISCCHSQPENAAATLEELFRSGAEPERFLSVLFTCIRNLWLQSRWGEKVLKTLMLSEEEHSWILAEKDFLDEASLERLMTQIASLTSQVRRGLTNDVLCGLLVSWIFASGTSPATEILPERNATAGKFTPPSFFPRDRVSETKISARASATQESKIVEDATTSQSSGSEKSTLQTDLPIPEIKPFNVKAVPLAPDFSGLPSPDNELKVALESSIFQKPQFAIPILLADIALDGETQSLFVQLDAGDLSAYESLKKSSAAEFLQDRARQIGKDIKNVYFYCGKETESFEKVKSSGATSATENFRSVETKISAKNFSPEKFDFLPEKKSAAGLQPQDDVILRNTSKSAGQSLTEYLRGFMEGDLLYCRPNEKPEEGEGDDEE